MKVILDTDPQKGQASIQFYIGGQPPTVEEMCLLRDLFDSMIQDITTVVIHQFQNDEKNHQNHEKST